MRTKNTFSTKFWLQTSRAINNHALLYVRINVNGKRLNISLKKKIDLSTWDAVNKRVKGRSLEANTVNTYLTKVETKLFQIYQDLVYKDQFITVELIKASYLGENETRRTLKEIIEYHRVKIENTHAPGTISNFSITMNYVDKFLQERLKTTDIYLNELNYKFINDLESFLISFYPKGHHRAMKNNTVMKHLQRLRKIVTMAYHLEWLDKDPFIRWKPNFEKTEIGFLTDCELSSIETYMFSIERLDRVRDLFVFSCYTGISYVDIMALTKHHIHKGIDGSDWIITKRQKTNTPVKVPLLAKAQEIINKYKNHPITEVQEKLLPNITNEKLNFYLKEVALMCDIKKNLTFHMARHTFATTVTLTNGVPIETVSKMLGHTKIATTQIYAKVIESKVSRDMNALRNILNKNNENNSKNLNINIS